MDEELDVFRSEAGCLVMRKQVTRNITGHLDSPILSYDELSPALFEAAAEAARGYGSQYITVEVAPERADALLALGYSLESCTISVATADWPAPEGSPYAIRPKLPEDDFSIALLNSTLLPYTLCGGREHDMADVTFRSMHSVMEKLGRDDPNCLTLVLTKADVHVGHLILTLSEDSGYIFDLAVAQEHWGGRAVLQIMRAGSRELFHRSIPVLTGDVSAANLRALKIACRNLGFAVVSHRYVRKL